MSTPHTRFSRPRPTSESKRPQNGPLESSTLTQILVRFISHSLVVSIALGKLFGTLQVQNVHVQKCGATRAGSHARNVQESRWRRGSIPGEVSFLPRLRSRQALSRHPGSLRLSSSRDHSYHHD